MKKLILLLNLVIFSYLSGTSQNVYYEEVSFDYIRKPLQPLSKEIKNYSGEIIISYEDKVNEQKKNWAEEKAAIKTEVDQEQNDYKEKSLANKAMARALLDEKKPKKVIIEEKYFAKIHDKNTYASKIKLSGYNKEESSDLKITISFLGFEHLIEDVFANNVYKYKISYKHPMELELLNTIYGDVIYKKAFDELNEFRSTTTKGFTSKIALEKYWQENVITFMRKLDEKITEGNFKKVIAHLNNQFSYSEAKRNLKVALVKPKKYSYDEHNTAFENIFMGYNALENKEESVGMIKEAIKQWEEVLKETDKNDKKARINVKIAAATHLNCAEAYCWLDNYVNAKKHLMKVKMLNVGKYERKVDEYKKFIEDKEKRFKASIKNI